MVHVITRLEHGGAQENTLYTCEHLDPSRYRVVLAYGPGDRLDDRAQIMDHVTRWPIANLVRSIAPRADALALSDLTRRIARARADHRRAGFDPRRFIVHTHSSKAGILGRMAAAAARVPLIIHGIHGFGFFQGQHPAKFAFFVAAERAVARVTRAFFSVSEACLDEARRRHIVGRHHYAQVVRSGMELAAFRSDDARRSACRRALDIQDDTEVVLTVANFKPQKDPLTLITAFADVAQRRPNALLLFAGDGPLRGHVESEIAHRGLQQQVRLLGWRRDVPDLLAACDVVALSSIFEGLPRSAVQAVAARRPFAGTNVDGTPEIIRPGKNGYLVPPRDPRALARAIDDALTHRPVDPDDVARLQAWDARTMVTTQEAAYEHLLTTSPSAH